MRWIIFTVMLLIATSAYAWVEHVYPSGLRTVSDCIDHDQNGYCDIQEGCGGPHPWEPCEYQPLYINWTTGGE